MSKSSPSKTNAPETQAVQTDPETHSHLPRVDGVASSQALRRKKGTAYSVYPAPAYFDIYPDPSYVGPSYIFTPPGGLPGNLSLQIYRAALPSGSGPAVFDFYSNGMSQYLYIPYIQTVTTAPTSTPKITQSNLLTNGVASCVPSPTLDASPLYYPTLTVQPAGTAWPSFETRINSLLAPASAPTASYVPGNAIVSYRNGGQEVVLRLNNLPGLANPVCFAWRKLVVDYADAVSCPAGYAGGPEDLFLQCNC